MEGNKQSPVLAFRLPSSVTKEEKDELTTRIKEAGRKRNLEVHELFLYWLENDDLLGEVNLINKVNNDITQEILDRLEKLDGKVKELESSRLPLNDDVRRNVRQGSPEREALISRAKKLRDEDKDSKEIAQIFNEEGIPTLTGKVSWSDRDVRRIW